VFLFVEFAFEADEFVDGGCVEFFVLPGSDAGGDTEGESSF
jgi:hypothetical protein